MTYLQRVERDLHTSAISDFAIKPSRNFLSLQYLSHVRKESLDVLACGSSKARDLTLGQNLHLHLNFVYGSSVGSGESVYLGSLAYTPASNLGYLAPPPPEQLFMGAK